MRCCQRVAVVRISIHILALVKQQKWAHLSRSNRRFGGAFKSPFSGTVSDERKVHPSIGWKVVLGGGRICESRKTLVELECATQWGRILCREILVELECATQWGRILCRETLVELECATQWGRILCRETLVELECATKWGRILCRETLVELECATQWGRILCFQCGHLSSQVKIFLLESNSFQSSFTHFLESHL